MTSEPAHIATSPASGPLWTKPGSFLPTTNAASVPPAIAISEFIATSPEILSIVCADITLKPNQPTDSTHAPSARNGIDDGGCAEMPPCLRYRPRRAPSISTATRRDPAAERVDDDAAGEVVELRAERGLEPALDAEVLVPRDALEERIEEADEHERGEPAVD